MKRELKKHIPPPKNIHLLKEEVEEICFRQNDSDLSNVDTLFIFGARFDFQNIKETVEQICKKASIQTVIITGGVNPDTDPLTESEVILDLIKNVLPKNVQILLEKKSKNTLENVSFTLNLYPNLPSHKICFISKSFAGGRCYLTLRKYLPNTLILQQTYYANKCSLESWMNNKNNCSRIWGEIIRIETYGKRGDILYTPVQKKLEKILKFSEF